MALPLLTHLGCRAYLSPPGPSAFHFISRAKLQRKEGGRLSFSGVRGVDARIIQFSLTLKDKAVQPHRIPVAAKL